VFVILSAAKDLADRMTMFDDERDQSRENRAVLKARVFAADGGSFAALRMTMLRDFERFTIQKKEPRSRGETSGVRREESLFFAVAIFTRVRLFSSTSDIARVSNKKRFFRIG